MATDPVPSPAPRIAAMTPVAIDAVRRLEAAARGLPPERRASIATGHVIHGGMYARTIRVPAGAAITGALVEVATILVIDGDTLVHVGDEAPLRLAGRHVVPASAGRKQAFVALADTHITMMFPTAARTVEEAERAFTAEADRLGSRREPSLNHVVITGE